jgi:hypothetical protein
MVYIYLAVNEPQKWDTAAISHYSNWCHSFVYVGVQAMVNFHFFQIKCGTALWLHEQSKQLTPEW